MPKITAVEPQKKNPNRFNIFLDGQFAFGADEDLVVEHRLIPEKVIDKEFLNKLLFEAEVGKLMERMYRLFEVRQRSEKEVRDYIRNLSFKRKIKDEEEISSAAIDLLVNKLKQKRLLSDEEFAKSWVQARRRSKQKGIFALKQELFQKGISKQIIEEVLMQTEGSDDSLSESKMAEKALEKKMRLWKNLSETEFKKKSYDFLLRRGFEYEVVKSVIEKLTKKE